MRRIVIADEQPVTRHAVRVLLEKDGFEVVAETDDGLDAQRIARDLRPDLIVVGLRLKRLAGLELVRRLHRHEDAPRTLILASQDSEHLVGLCVDAGASGFVSKRDDLSELLLAIRSVLQHHSFFPARTLDPDLNRSGDQSEAALIASLSPREKTVLYYLASGHTNRAIADDLLLSDRTVSTFKSRVFRKLKIDNMMELAELAWRNHILGSEPVALGSKPPPGVSPDSRDLLRKVLDALPSALSINDAEGRLLFANEYLLALYERKRDEVLGARLSELNVIAAEEAILLEETFAEAFVEARSFAREVVVTYAGEAHTVQFWGAPIHNATGETVAMICGLQNLEEIEHAFLLLREAREQVESLSRARNRLLAQTIESLRNELKAFGSAPDPDGISQALAAIEMKLDNIQTMIEADASTAAGVHVRCEIRKLTTEVVDGLRRTHRDVRLRLDAAQSFEAWCWLDKGGYQNLLNNVLHHAASNAHAGALDVVLHVRSQSRALLDVEVTIRGQRQATGGTQEGPPNKPGLRSWMEKEVRLAHGVGATLTSHGVNGEIDVRIQMTVAKSVHR
jgi:DNA-binding NarL/FixJ family response regulator